MPRKTRKLKHSKTRKQRLYSMIGCSKKHKHSNKCFKKYRRNIKHGGSGCGPQGCPIAALSASDMNKYGGEKLLVEPNGVTGGKPILGTGQNGGNCSMCNMTGGGCGCTAPLLTGGSATLPLMPGPFVGQPYNAINGLPGSGIQGNNNYYPLKNVAYDPSTQMVLDSLDIIGGRKNKHKTKKNKKNKNKKGGGFIPQELVNLGRDFTYSFNTAYNSLNGIKAPTDPTPYKGQLINTQKFII